MFFFFQYGFRYSQSSADLLTVGSDRYARAFNRSGANQAEHLIYSRLLTGFGMLVFFTNLSLMEFQVRYLALFFPFLVIDSFKWFWMGSFQKNTQLILELLKGPFLVLHFSYYRLITYLMLSVILLSILVTLLSTLSVIRHHLWQQLELASELESDLQDTVV